MGIGEREEGRRGGAKSEREKGERERKGGRDSRGRYVRVGFEDCDYMWISGIWREGVADLVPSDAQVQFSDSRAGSSSSVYCSLCQAGTYGTGSG